MTEHEKWEKWLNNEMHQPYFLQIEEEAKKMYASQDLTPVLELWYNSLSFPNMEKINVIIVGNQPFYESYASDGFAFSSIDEIDFEMGLLYKKIYKDLNIIYNQQDNTKDRWLQQGILCFPMNLTAPSGVKNYYSKLWLPFTTKVLKYWMHERRPKAFLFFDQYTQNIPKFLWDKKSLPHLFIQKNIRTYDFMNEPIFSRVNAFIKEQYNYDIMWE